MSELQQIVEQARSAIASTSSIADLEQAKARFLGKSGTVTEQLKTLGKLPADQRPQAGAAINEAKRQVEELIQAKLDELRSQELNRKLAGESIDVTLPGRRQGAGGLHPIARCQERVEKIFASMG